MTKKREIQIILDKLWIEYSQLYQKVNNLEDFIKNRMALSDGLYGQSMDITKKLVFVNQKQQELLCKQLEFMKQYLNCLSERISDLGEQYKNAK